MPAWKNPNLPLPLKPCPRCHGSGRVPKPPGRRDEQVAESIAWAQSWHGKMVVVTHWDGQQFPGLAISYIERGGWGAIRVYTPKPVYSQGRTGDTYPVTERGIQSRFPHYKVPKRAAERLSLLQHWDDNDELAGIKALTGLTAELEAAWD